MLAQKSINEALCFTIDVAQLIKLNSISALLDISFTHTFNLAFIA
jgi:hypothetical protein